MTVEFELEGQRFIGINGGPLFKFTPAISFLVSCETKEEVDDIWKRLSKVARRSWSSAHIPSAKDTDGLRTGTVSPGR